MVKISKNRGAWVKIAKIEQNSRQVGMFTYLIAKVFFPILVPTPNAEHLLDSTAVLTMQNGEFRFSQCGDMRHPSSKVMFEPVNLFVPVSLRISCQSIVS